MNHVELLVEKMSVFKHGLTREHVRRERDRQNFKIAQQLAFKCVQESFDDLITGKVDGCPPDSTLLGTKVYLNVIHHYIEIFASPVLPLKSRISYAGLVVKFLSVWRNYIFWEEGLTLKNNFISNQCYLDIISSCHCAVMCYFHDAYPFQPFPIIRMGSDCCETCLPIWHYASKCKIHESAHGDRSRKQRPAVLPEPFQTGNCLGKTIQQRGEK